MNATIKPAVSAPEVTTTAPSPRLCHPTNWALCGAREHLDDWRRIHSIFRSMSTALQKEIDEANAKKELMETGFAIEFMQNIDWLMELMEHRRIKLYEEIREAI